jgi:pyruvate kinase
MPSEAADDPRIIRDFLTRGMDCMRINCAHDDAAAWDRMIGHLRHAQRELGRDCRVLMDLAGPKLRTGALPPREAVVHWKPRRDDLGRSIEPARVWMPPAEAPAPAPAPCAVLPLPAAWLATLAQGESVAVDNAPGGRRRLRVTSRVGRSVWAESKRGAYVLSGALIRRLAPRAARGRIAPAARVGPLPSRPGSLLLRCGDTLVLTREGTTAAVERSPRSAAAPPRATIPCSLPEVFGALRRGERVWFDDGKLGGIVRRVECDAVHVEITHAKPLGTKLHGGRGINLPDTDLQLPALTNHDIRDLAFVAKHADIVGLSFVQCPEDVHELRARLQALGAGHLGIVLKIETLRAFERLPQLLLAALHARAAGVMIARGDLAVECGWEHLAEIQEEILGLCEAAHLPVIWATQVLESLAKRGLPSRAEITDAAMSGTAEGVLLNKGPHVGAAIDVLAEILQRMAPHRDKRAARLPRSWAWRSAQPPVLAAQRPVEFWDGDAPGVAGAAAASGTNSIRDIKS